MAYQAPFRVRQLERAAHRIRVNRDPVVNDPTLTAEEKAHRAERLRSPLMAMDHDAKIAHVPGALLFRQAVAADDDDDVMHFYGS